MIPDLPEHFVKPIIGVYGDKGAAWIASFPEYLAAVAERYDLTLGAPFVLSYNYVCAATRRDGTPVVLKVSVPNPEFYTEIAALRHYGVEGSVEVLEADPDAGILIMERIFPGTMLSELDDDDEATRILARVMSKLWRPLPSAHSFPTVEKWSRGLQRLRDDHQGGTGPLPAHLVERAEATFRELLASATSSVLLHGDFHHDNILRATRVPYLAIDPKGLAGEPAYEVGPLFYNPGRLLNRTSDIARLSARRADILSEHLQIDRQRILDSAFAYGILSAAWSVEDHDDGWTQTIKIAEPLLTL